MGSREFQAIKKYKLKSVLKIYISVSEITIDSFLAQDEKNNVEKVMYYLSFSIKDVENRYLLIEKLCLTVYFSSTTLILHDILCKVNFKNWSDQMYVDEMSIEWTHMKMDFYFIGVSLQCIFMKVVKGQSIVDFLVDHPWVDT